MLQHKATQEITEKNFQSRLKFLRKDNKECFESGLAKSCCIMFPPYMSVTLTKSKVTGGGGWELILLG